MILVDHIYCVRLSIDLSYFNIPSFELYQNIAACVTIIIGFG